MPASDAGGDSGGGDDSTLLAVPPGNKDEPRLTPGAKGHVYRPVRTDGRTTTGGRRSSNTAKVYAGDKPASHRNLGFAGINSIPKTSTIAKGFYERQEPTYKTGELVEEEHLFKVDKSIEIMLEGLDTFIDKNLETRDED